MGLAAREVRHAWPRFVLLIAAVALLLILLAGARAIGDALITTLSGAVRVSDAPVLVTEAGVQGDVRVSRLEDHMVARVAAVDGVADVGRIGQATVTGDLGDGPVDLTLWGMEPDQVGAPETLVAGRLPHAPGEAAVDRADAGGGMTPGATIAVPETGERFPIVGLTRDSRFYGTATAYVTFQQWQATLEALYPDADEMPASVLAVAPEPGRDPQHVANDIEAAVTGVEAHLGPALADQLPGLPGISQSFTLLTAAAFGTVALVVGLFFLTFTVQKARMLAVLRAVGASTARLGRTVALQVSLVVAAGTGVAAAVLFGVEALVPPTYPLTIDLALVMSSGVAVLGVGLVASLAAVARIARLDPAAACNTDAPGPER
jgi:putative ABC transport system permease protein